MSIAWAIAISLYVLLERLLPLGRRFDRAMGAALVALGLWRLVVPA
jgi:predicted metal-binding membrane protein